MGDVIEDVWTAFDQARHQMADDFDYMRQDNMKAYTNSAQQWVNGVAKEYGYDGAGAVLTYSAAFLASSGEVLLNFVQGVGASTFIDPLRLGDGVKKGTAGGYLEDTLRVVGIVGGAVKVLKFGAYLRGASKVGGGMMSCLPTSAGKALVQSRIIAIPTVEEMAQGTNQVLGPGTVRFPSPYYQGSLFQEVLPNVQKAGAVVDTEPVANVQNIVSLVNQNRGPVLFAVEWQGGGRHAMMAYRPFFGSGVRIADQFGNMHTLEAAGNVNYLKLGPGTTTAGMLGAPSFRPGMMWAIKSVDTTAYVVRDAVLLDVAANAPIAQRVGVPIYEAIDEQFFPKLAYRATFLPTAPPRLKKVADHVRNAPAAAAAGAGSSAGAGKRSGPGPGSGIPLRPDAQKMLQLVGPPGTTIDWQTLRSKALGAGLANPHEYESIEELEGWGAVTVQRFGADTKNIRSVTRN